MVFLNLSEGAPVTRVRIMYWKEIPVQVQVEDGQGKVSRQLDLRFQEAVDAVAMFDGSLGTDDYLAAWGWGPYAEVAGGAQQAADGLAERLNVGFPQDMAERIRALHQSGNRDPRPGAIDGWLKG